MCDSKGIDKATRDRWCTELTAAFPNLPGVKVTVYPNADQIRFDRLIFSIIVPDPARQVAGFSISHMPNCGLYIISTDTWVQKDFQRRGIASTMLIHKKRIARDLGAERLLATVVDSNVAEIACLKKAGWKRLEGNGRVGLWSVSTADKFYT